MINDNHAINKTARLSQKSDYKPFASEFPPQPQSWQTELAQAIRDPQQLLSRLQLPENMLEGMEAASQKFPLLVTESFLSRMQPGNREDPLLLQVLPQISELEQSKGFTADPVGDSRAMLMPGVLQKYHGRALLMTTGTCAVHCRYCFRREYPYQAGPQTMPDWEAQLQMLDGCPEIEEIILSGGDPLVWSDSRLEKLVDLLESFPQIQRLRIHSRLPIVLPSRVTPELIDMLTCSRLQAIMVVHANHPHEIVGDAAENLKLLVGSGIPVLNQAVLLQKINDTAATQFELCRRLINLGVIPYYLHQLDRVQGAAHFEADAQLGIEIIKALKAKLPGYAIPRFVQEIPGEVSKTEFLPES